MTFDDLARGKNGKGEPLSPDWVPEAYDGIQVGYGSQAYELTESDLERLRAGDMMFLDVQGEYGVWIRLKPNSGPSSNSPMGEL